MFIWKRLFVCFIACLAFAAARASAEIIISEIMFNPEGDDNDSAGTDYTFSREWVELYNTGASTVDISGWQFGDSQDNTWASPFPAGATIGAGQSLIVTGDSTSFYGNWGGVAQRIAVTAFPNLANSPSTTNETAALRRPHDTIAGAYTMVDAVNFADAATGWPTANGTQGNSIFLLPGALSSTANDVGSNWRPSSAGVYGARWTNAGGLGQNHGSPGVVVTQTQTPFAPTPGAVWSMVVLPDTQNYSKSSRDMPIFHQMTNWVKDHRDEFNIRLVMQEGDLVNNNNTNNPTSGDQTGSQQWANARAAMSVLDGHVPYIITLGNHDIGTTNAQSRETQFNTYFNAFQNPLNDPSQGGILKGLFQPGRLDNAYFEVKGPDGRDLLVFALEFLPRQAVINWAKGIAQIPGYRDHTAILLTHTYMNWNEQRTTTVAGPELNNDGVGGEGLWQQLVRVTGNFEMTFSGHVGGDGIAYVPSIDNHGDVVHQMLLNTQFETNGGNGWMRIVEFLNDGRTVQVRTYSPFLDLYRTDAANQFQIQLTPLWELQADFDHNDQVDVADLAKWASGLGTTDGALQTTGDANLDGAVDGSDFLAWQRQYGRSASASAAQSAVPEPAAAVLLAVAAIGLRLARRDWRAVVAGAEHAFS